VSLNAEYARTLQRRARRDQAAQLGREHPEMPAAEIEARLRGIAPVGEVEELAALVEVAQRAQAATPRRLDPATVRVNAPEVEPKGKSARRRKVREESEEEPEFVGLEELDRLGVTDRLAAAEADEALNRGDPHV
jgi:hypothetical protein